MSTKQTVLDVKGMTCSNCVRHVKGALEKLEGISSVAVKLREGEVTVEHDPQKAPVDRMIAALDEEGYDSTARAS